MLQSASMNRGRPPYEDILTPREWEVLTLIGEGLTNEQIANRLGISENTAKFHVSEILSKLGVGSRTAAATWQQSRPGVPALAVPFLAGQAAEGGRLLKLLKLVSLGAVGAGALGFFLLALGVGLMSLRGSDEPLPQPLAVVEPPPARAASVSSPVNSVFSSLEDAPPPRQHPLFLDKTGFLEVTRYDDRNLTDDEKLQDPVVNPRWEPFAECVAADDLEVRDDPAIPYTQADLDRLVAVVNLEGPFEVATPRGLVYTGTSNSDSFLACAERFLR
ncbi:MAG: hypothetical protein GEU75_13370 [Dehalococcoidia bacterium]|nr:hypothetical protein [Dehalococcoidia bacterium]